MKNVRSLGLTLCGKSLAYTRRTCVDFVSGRSVIALGCVALAIFVLGCGEDGSQTADNGGIGGTGVSQGTISAFGSIFVNGIEWEIDSASIELDGVTGNESDLRIGMKVRVVGDFAGDGLNGAATSVRFDDSIEGPISDTPVLTLPGGSEKTFTILGRTIVVDEFHTVFADGASYAALAMGQVFEVSGFDQDPDTVRATRLALRGLFSAVTASTLPGVVQNLMKNPNGSGIFELGVVTIRYVASTQFSGLTRADLAVGQIVDVKGVLGVSGSEIDATEIELEAGGLGQEDAEDVELEGVVSNFVSLSDFRLAGVVVDASGATLDPPGLVIVDGLSLEAEGSLVGGVIIAAELENKEDDDGEEIAIRASISAIDTAARELTILGVIVFADGDTELEDERDGDENFRFSEIGVGDWLEIEGLEAGAARIRAKQIKRDSVKSDVILRGPVTDLDRVLAELSVLGQPLTFAAAVAYFDEIGQPRTEEEFFRTPGDVALDDYVTVRDENAADPAILTEIDRVELE